MKIIAEIGINHDGSFQRAERLVTLAAQSGCDGVKFQYRNLGRSYVAAYNEIGDEILKEETSKAYLSPKTIEALARLSRSLGMEVGISFFTVEDVEDFPSIGDDFDFFKIPSVELTNRPLLQSLQALSKQIYISLGAHSEEEIDKVLSTLPDDDSWTPMHCVSNYPVALHNSSLGYLSFLAKKWARPVGFSSHDEHYETCLLAMQQGASVIERHITVDRGLSGLDHSSSSTPDEFAKLRYFADNFDQMMSGEKPRVPNSGELINLQNLGRSFYAKDDLETGSAHVGDFVYRSPRAGLGIEIFEGNSRIELVSPLRKDKPLTVSSISGELIPDVSHISYAKKNKLALPVRIHDYEEISRKFPIGTYEFHLSYQEVLGDVEWLEKLEDRNKFSIHLPDYVSSTELLDPFYAQSSSADRSSEILSRVSQLAIKIQEKTGQEVPLVGSFSIAPKGKAHFYDSIALLIHQFSERGLKLMPQWLPPFAWYFGGSKRLTVFNDALDAEMVSDRRIQICLDTSHLLMGANYHALDANLLFDSLLPQAGHLHISDAQGVDGEGAEINTREEGNWRLISRAIETPVTKVIEVWQGHLDNYRGFAREIMTLAQTEMQS